MLPTALYFGAGITLLEALKKQNPDVLKGGAQPYTSNAEKLSRALLVGITHFEILADSVLSVVRKGDLDSTGYSNLAAYVAGVVVTLFAIPETRDQILNAVNIHPSSRYTDDPTRMHVKTI